MRVRRITFNMLILILAKIVKLSNTGTSQYLGLLLRCMGSTKAISHPLVRQLLHNETALIQIAAKLPVLLVFTFNPWTTRYSFFIFFKYHCPASRTTLVATRFRVAVICPIIQVLHCIRVFFYFVWFVFINHIFQFYYELCTYCNILDIYLS